MLELLDVRLVAISPQGLHLRGYEALGAARSMRYAIQGRIIRFA